MTDNLSGQSTVIDVYGPGQVTPNPVQQAMSGNKFANPTWTFPSDLGSVERGEEPYVIFNIISSVAKNRKLLGSIALNMPTSVVSSYSVGYENVEMKIDTLATWLNAIRHGNIGATDIAVGVAQSIDKLIPGMENTVAKVEQLAGKIVNPHMANIFKGVNYRSFSFVFDLVPKNKQESDNINQIIKQFKFHMHPSVPEGIGIAKYFIYPDNFVIGLFSPKQDYLFKISTCVLDKLEVDYGGTGVPAFFESTAAPVAIKLTMEFKEIELMTQERISEGY